VAKPRNKFLTILLIPVGMTFALIFTALGALAFYTFFDWRFVLYVVPTGIAAALLVAGAINYWSVPERHRQ